MVEAGGWSGARTTRGRCKGGLQGRQVVEVAETGDAPNSRLA